MKKAETKTKPKKSVDSQEDRVKDVVKKFETSWDYCQKNYHVTWETAWKLYNNKRVKIGYEGYSNYFVPMTFSTIETMVAALAGGKPSIDFVPPKDKPDQDTDVLNALLDSYWDKDQWNIKVQSWVRSMLLYGTGVIYLQWYEDHPVMVNLPLRDFFFNPNDVSMESCGPEFYAGRRYLTTLSDLKSYEVVDSDTQEMKPKYINLDEISASSGGHTGEETDKEKKDMFYGSTVSDPENTQVECIELWTEDKVVTVANRSILIQDDENEYKRRATERNAEAVKAKQPEPYPNPKGIIPFAIQRDYVDESLFLARGEVETFSDLQEWLNDITSQNNDAITYVLNPMARINPDKADMAESVGAAPGRILPLAAGDFEWLPLQAIPNDAFNERLNIKNEIRETTAVDQVVKGVTSDTKTTATEINAQVASAGQRIGMKVTQLENEGFHRLARIVFEMVKLYVTDPMIVRVVGNGVSYQGFDPAAFQGNYEPRVQLQSSVDANKQKDEKQAQEMYLALSADPAINQDELKRLVLPKMWDLDPDEVDKLLTPAPTAMDPSMGGMPGMGPTSQVPLDPSMLAPASGAGMMQ